MQAPWRYPSSPHLERINESITLDGVEISDTELEAVMEKIHDTCEKHLLTQFEALTVAAICYYKEQNTDVVIMEVGMGGALDATNVFSENIMSVILGISLDHTSYLGSTIRDIALEKSGIMKKGCPVFSAAHTTDAIEVIEDRARELECRIYTPIEGANILSCAPNCTVFEYNGEKYTLSSGAGYQVKNAVKVLSSLEALKDSGINISKKAISCASALIKRPARFEVFSEDPYVIFDGGHNPECAEALAEDIKRTFPDKKPDIIMGVMADKDVFGICSILCPIIGKVYTVKPQNPRAMEDTALAEVLRSLGVEALPCKNFKNALEKWQENGKNDLLCVGSLYSYKEFKEEFLSFKG